MLQIPTQATPSYSMRVRLDGAYYTLRFRWNVRAVVWILDVLDAAGAAIALGIAVRSGVPLNNSANGAGPPGMLWAQDTSGTGADPGFDELGGRVVLIYVEATELEAMR